MPTPWKRRTLVALMSAILLGASITMPSHASDTVERPHAITLSGLVQGERHEAADVYQGIPYAAPPVDDLRWRSPQQRPLPGTSEDCLYLNVTTPNARPGAGKPVMVWVHGGNNVGKGSDYHAERMAARGDVVVVTINYRLGMLGFFSHPELEGSGTFALQDQQAALQWVRRNAVFFGGDPANVTLFGESAGGVNTCAHLTSPGARGLFARAILQSGSCSTEIPAFNDGSDIVLERDDFWTPVEELHERGEAVAEERGCATDEPVDCLRRQPADDLVREYDNVFGIASGTPTLPIPPDVALARGRFHRVPVLSGTTRDESRLLADVIGVATGPITQQRLDEVIDRAFGGHADEVRASYPVDHHEGDPRLAFAAMDTDRAFTCPQLMTGRALSRHVPTYGYEFADRTAPTYVPFFTDVPPGASHASELAYLFDLELGPWGPGFTEVDLTAEQRRLGDAMIDTWARFAWTGTTAWQPLAPDTASSPVQSFAPGPGGIALVDAWAEHRCDLWTSLR